MKHLALRLGIGLGLLVGLAGAWAARPARAAPARQFDDPVKQGEYLAEIAGCRDCHTPFGADGQFDFSRAFAGGQAFDLGQLGIVYTPNLTPDKETGLGNWTDEEIKVALRTGVSQDGLHQFPIMPYVFFNQMADADIDAIVAYLRTVPAVSNKVERKQILPPEALPQLPMTSGLTAPDPADTAARAEYLFRAVLACTDCHTPLNAETGQPQMDKFLSGGQPYEGPWGIVYAANITPDKETGLGAWSDDDIKRALRTGVRPDGRLLVLMPWQAYSKLTDEDLNAVVYQLRNNVPPVVNEVPDPALNEGFEIIVEPPKTNPAPNIALWIGVGVAIATALGAGAFMALRSRGTKPPTQSGS